MPKVARAETGLGKWVVCNWVAQLDANGFNGQQSRIEGRLRRRVSCRFVTWSEFETLLGACRLSVAAIDNNSCSRTVAPGRLSWGGREEEKEVGKGRS